MMAERDVNKPIWSWRSMLISAVAMGAAGALALLLIEPLSLRATIQGGLIAFGTLFVSRLVQWWVSRPRK